MSAAPKAISEFQIPGDEDVDPPLATGVGVSMAGVGAPTTVNPNATSAAIATSFKIINTFCVVLPARTPRQLMIVKTASASAARNAAKLSLACACPSEQTYFANVTATAAIPPVCVTRSRAQP